jgi:hypothetical protein
MPMNDDRGLADILIRQRIEEELRLHKRIEALTKALARYVNAYASSADPIGDSDLFDEQPIAVRVTLGDHRHAARVLSER